MQFRALVEEWDNETIVFIRELPGCFASAMTGEAAIHSAHQAVSAHLLWMVRRRLPLPCDPRDAIRITVEEWLPASYEIENVGPLFNADRLPPTPEALETALAVADAARAELRKLYQNTPPAARALVIPPDMMTMDEHLAHLARTELWYVAALNDGRMPTARLHDNPSEALKASGDYAANRLRSLPPDLMAHVFERDGELWTAAKVLRRMVAHLREHTPQVERLANHAGV